MNIFYSSFKNFFTVKSHRKVPEISIIFWIVKLLTTAMGEATSDFMVRHMDPVIAVCIGCLGFLIAIVIQFIKRRYIPLIYWFTVSMVAIFGTMAADVVHIVIGIPYIISTLFFSFMLTVIFIVWYKTEKTLSIHSIYTFQRELFYWLTVLTTFALGTAIGDLTAQTFGLGYLVSGLLFAVLFIIPVLGFRFFRFNSIFSFWFAYIITRPLGASFADWLGRTPDLGGIGFGTGKVSLTLTFLIICFIIYLTITHRVSNVK